jgi:hypothetical protein
MMAVNCAGSFKARLAAEKMGEIWVMDPKNGMGYGVIEFYGF